MEGRRNPPRYEEVERCVLLTECAVQFFLAWWAVCAGFVRAACRRGVAMSVDPEFMGLVAGVLTTCGMIPQLWKTWRSRDVSGLSVGMMSITLAGVGLWFFYGVLLGSRPMIVANGLTFIFYFVLLCMKFIYGRNARRSLVPEEPLEPVAVMEAE